MKFWALPAGPRVELILPFGRASGRKGFVVKNNCQDRIQITAWNPSLTF